MQKHILSMEIFFCGIEHASQNGGEILFCTILKKNKKVLDIETTFEETSFEKATSALSKKQHICLIINNDNVLTKQIEGSDSDAN